MSPHIVAELHGRWTLERLLGSGSQGQVWQARHRRRPTKVMAVKLLRKCSDAQREVEAYEQLRHFESHPNVLDAAFGWDDGCVGMLHIRHMHVAKRLIHLHVSPPPSDFVCAQVQHQYWV